MSLKPFGGLKSGRPVPGIEVRVVDDEGHCLPQDGLAVGELQLRGAWVTGEYLDTESDAFAPDGWLRTGDVGMVDARGYVQLTDRTKDVIKSGGEWISSVDLEDVLLKHAAVTEVAVIAMPDERWQERPWRSLSVSMRARRLICLSELRQFLAERVAKFWIPEYWCLRESIPKTSVGKIDKKGLREALASDELVVQRQDS